MAESKTLQRSRPEDKSNQHKSSRETAVLSVLVVIPCDGRALTSLIDWRKIELRGRTSFVQSIIAALTVETECRANWCP